MSFDTQSLAVYAAHLRFDDLPHAVVSRSKLLVLNLAGSVLRAGKDANSLPCLHQSLSDLGWSSSGPAYVPGLGQGMSPPVAALLTGILGHTLAYDDFHATAMIHPSASVVAAAFAVGQSIGASGREVLTAIIAGNEVACRIGLALNASPRPVQDLDAVTFGAAAASARLYGLDVDGFATAFALAGSYAAGADQGLAQGAWTKDWQAGQSAMNGVIAATLARNGFVAARSEGLAAGTGVSGLGQTYETLNIGINTYPSSLYTHAALAGLATMMAEHRLQVDEIQSVRIGLHQNGIDLTADPQNKASTVAEAQFSMAFTAAVMMRQGHFGWDDYSLLDHPDITALAARIDIRRDVRLEGLTHPFGAHLAITTPEGEITRREPTPTGAGPHFPKEQAVLKKFFSLATPVLDSKAGAMADMILGLDRIATLRDAFQ